MIEGLTGTVSVTVSKQVRQYENVTVFISASGITSETPAEDIEELVKCQLTEAVKVVGRIAEKRCLEERDRMRNSGE